jgi:hypothetical protein
MPDLRRLNLAECLWRLKKNNAPCIGIKFSVGARKALECGVKTMLLANSENESFCS